MYELHSRSCASLLLPVTFLALASGLFGCKNTPAATPQNDAALTEAVQVKLSSDTSLGGEPIQASVQQGVATLTGSVSSDAARALAANDIAQIGGIHTVVNNLTVQSPATVQPSRTVASAPMPPHVQPEKTARRSRPPVEDQAPMPAKVAQEVAPPPAPIERQQPQGSTPRPQASAAPAIRSVTLDSGTTLPIRITQTLDSASTQQGDTFSGVLDSDIVSDGIVVLRQGTPVSGRVTAVQEAAHFKGSSLLTIELTSIDRHGDHLPIATDSFSKSGNGRGKNTAEKIGGGAAVGAILGGILGGGKGAAIGAAAGGGAGTGVQAVTKGKQVQIESETLVRFHLSGPITVRVTRGSASREAKDDAPLERDR